MPRPLLQPTQLLPALSLSVALILAACAHQPGPGLVSTQTLRQSAPQFARAETADPQELAALTQALQNKGPIALTVYFGDWCSDSIREVPKLLALLEQLPANQVQLTLINLDRDKSDPAGHAKTAGVQRIPTIVAQRNEQELGRIVEKPAVSVGADLVELLKSGS